MNFATFKFETFWSLLGNDFPLTRCYRPPDLTPIPPRIRAGVQGWVHRPRPKHLQVYYLFLFGSCCPGRHGLTSLNDCQPASSFLSSCCASSSFLACTTYCRRRLWNKWIITMGLCWATMKFWVSPSAALSNDTGLSRKESEWLHTLPLSSWPFACWLVRACPTCPWTTSTFRQRYVYLRPCHQAI